jgi:hypothetical protein
MSFEILFRHADFGDLIPASDSEICESIAVFLHIGHNRQPL